MDRSLINEVKSKLNLSSMSKPARAGIALFLVLLSCCCVGTLIAVPSKTQVTIEPSLSSALAAESDEASTPKTVFVYVSGAVENPGLVELEADARVAVAIEKAGGFSSTADTSSVNLARIVTDGEQLFVAALNGGEDAQSDASAKGANAAVTSMGSVSDNRAAGVSNFTGKININTASKSELTALPGIGEATAQKIVDDRASKGSFKKIDELKRVSGIGEKKYEALRDLICV